MSFADDLFAAASPRVVMLDLLGDRVIKNGVTRCFNPSHPDENASMSVDLDKGLFHCFGASCGVQGGVIDAAVLVGRGRDKKEAADWLLTRHGAARSNGHTNGHTKPPVAAPIPAAWPYFPKTAARLGWEAVTASDGRPGLRLPTWHADGSAGKWKRRYQKREDKKLTGEFEDGDAKPGLINLPAFLATDRKVVAVVCGETDLLAWTFEAQVEGIEIVAVSHSTGEGSSLEPFVSAFRGAKVYFFPDNDAPGAAAGQRRALELKTVAAAVHMAHVPDPYKDVCDYVRAGGKIRDLLRIADTPAAIPWPDLISLDHFEQPTFPVDCLGMTLEAWCRATAVSLQVPEDVPAMLCLPVLAAACARKWEVEVRPGWREPLNLYCLTALPPGTRKSAVFTAATRIFYEIEETQKEQGKKEHLREVANYEMAQKKFEAANAQRASAKDAGAAAAAQASFERALKDFEELDPPRAEPRLIGDDVTPERVVSILAEQQDRFAIFSAEGGLLQTLAGARYNKSASPSYDALLKAHSGDPISHDRKTAASVSVMHPALTLGLCVQPEILNSLAHAPGAKGVGLLARFLYSIPVSPVGKREVRSPPVPLDVTMEYRRTIARLIETPVPDEPAVLKFTIHADDALAAFEEELERRIGPEGDLASLVEWASKLAGATARIACLLALQDRENPEFVESGDVAAAIRIARYLILHARVAFGIAAAIPEVEVAERIHNWTQRRSVQGFSTRDAFLAMKGGRQGSITRVDEVRPALQLLVEFGYIRPVRPPEKDGLGRPFADFYEVRPNSHK